jgi:Co/Zn/Cd efflux system component
MSEAAPRLQFGLARPAARPLTSRSRFANQASMPATSTSLSADERRRLQLVAAVSLAACALELVGGELAGSLAVEADALDFAAAGLAALVAVRPAPPRPGASLAMAAGLAVLALWVAVATLYRVFVQDAPEPSLMAALGVVALGGNGAILYLLRGHRAAPGLAPFWLRARNDSIGGATLILAAGVVALLHNSVADLTVAVVMLALFGNTLAPELRRAWRGWQVTSAEREPH